MSPNPNYRLRQEESREDRNSRFLLNPILSLDITFAASVGFGSHLLTWYKSMSKIVDSIIALSTITTLGVLIPLVVHLFQRRRYRNPTEIPELRMLLDRAARRMGYEKDFDIWTNQDQTLLLVTQSNFLSRAIVVSETAVQDILARPAEGEVVLAHAVSDFTTNYALSTDVIEKTFRVYCTSLHIVGDRDYLLFE